MYSRRRDARHPIVIGTLSLLCLVSMSQLAFGPGGSTVVRDMTYWSQKAFGLLLLASAIAGLASAAVDGVRGAKLERAGMTGCALALAFYAINVPGAVASWQTSMAIVFAGTAAGCAVRAAVVWRMLRGVK